MLYYTYIPFETVDEAVRNTILRDRGLTYNAAMDAMRGIVDPLMRKGKSEFTLTIKQIMALGHSERAARNALKVLKVSVLEETGEKVVYDRSRPMSVYRVRSEYFISKVPTNETELEEAVVRTGGKSAVLSAIKSQLKKEHGDGKVTTTMLRERYEELLDKTIERQARSYHFSRKGGI